jgi:hypothetical protein
MSPADKEQGRRGLFRRRGPETPATPEDEPAATPESDRRIFRRSKSEDSWSSTAWDDGWDDDWSNTGSRASVRPAADPRPEAVDAWLASSDDQLGDITRDMTGKWGGTSPEAAALAPDQLLDAEPSAPSVPAHPLIAMSSLTDADRSPDGASDFVASDYETSEVIPSIPSIPSTPSTPSTSDDAVPMEAVLPAIETPVIETPDSIAADDWAQQSPLRSFTSNDDSTMEQLASEENSFAVPFDPADDGSFGDLAPLSTLAADPSAGASWDLDTPDIVTSDVEIPTVSAPSAFKVSATKSVSNAHLDEPDTASGLIETAEETTADKVSALSNYEPVFEEGDSEADFERLLHDDLSEEALANEVDLSRNSLQDLHHDDLPAYDLANDANAVEEDISNLDRLDGAVHSDDDVADFLEANTRPTADTSDFDSVAENTAEQHAAEVGTVENHMVEQQEFEHHLVGQDVVEESVAHHDVVDHELTDTPAQATTDLEPTSASVKPETVAGQQRLGFDTDPQWEPAAYQPPVWVGADPVVIPEPAASSVPNVSSSSIQLDDTDEIANVEHAPINETLSDTTTDEIANVDQTPLDNSLNDTSADFVDADDPTTYKTDPEASSPIADEEQAIVTPLANNPSTGDPQFDTDEQQRARSFATVDEGESVEAAAVATPVSLLPEHDDFLDSLYDELDDYVPGSAIGQPAARSLASSFTPSSLPTVQPVSVAEPQPSSEIVPSSTDSLAPMARRWTRNESSDNQLAAGGTADVDVRDPKRALQMDPPAEDLVNASAISEIDQVDDEDVFAPVVDDRFAASLDALDDDTLPEPKTRRRWRDSTPTANNTNPLTPTLSPPDNEAVPNNNQLPSSEFVADVVPGLDAMPTAPEIPNALLPNFEGRSTEIATGGGATKDLLDDDLEFAGPLTAQSLRELAAKRAPLPPQAAPVASASDLNEALGDGSADQLQDAPNEKPTKLQLPRIPKGETSSTPVLRIDPVAASKEVNRALRADTKDEPLPLSGLATSTAEDDDYFFLTPGLTRILSRSGLALVVIAGLRMLLAIVSALRTPKIDARGTRGLLLQIGEAFQSLGLSHGLLLLVGVVLAAVPFFLNDPYVNEESRIIGATFGIGAIASLIGVIGGIAAAMLERRVNGIKGAADGLTTWAPLVKNVVATAGVSLVALLAALRAVKSDSSDNAAP